VKTIVGMRVDQIAIGGCTNSSIKDLLKVAYILKGKTIHPNVSVALNPASRQILRGLNKLGVLDWLLNAGVRLLENGCGPCIGMGFSPPTGGVSIRTYNRNFIGRSGTQNAFVYLTSPETAAASALTGIITDPRDLGMALIEINKEIPYIIDDSMIIPPAKNSRKVKVIKGPNIISLSLKEPIKRNIELDVQLKLGDNITTDDILPSGSNVLPFRSNLPKISNYTFINLDPKFVVRMKKNNKGVIIAGHNYGQGSSREHAALVLMYLGINIIIARSFSRIHRRNLINFGIVPLLFFNQNSYQKIDFGNKLFIQLENLDKKKIKVKNIDKNRIFYVTHDLDFREKSIVRAGGVLAYYKQIDK
jgi:aconitate hydratase